MKIIDLNQEKLTLSQVLKMAREENLILKTPQGSEFVLAETDDFEREVSLVRRNKSLMNLLARRSREKTKYSLDQVKKKLKLD